MHSVSRGRRSPRTIGAHGAKAWTTQRPGAPSASISDRGARHLQPPQPPSPSVQGTTSTRVTAAMERTASLPTAAASVGIRATGKDSARGRGSPGEKLDNETASTSIKYLSKIMLIR